MKIRAPMIISLFLVAGLLAVSPMATAMEQETYNFWEIAACPDEDIEMLGSVRFQTQSVQGGDHATWVFQAFWKADAWGLDSGADYRIQGKWMEVIQENPPFIFMWNDHFQLIGQGTAPNYRFYAKVKFLVDANGDVVIDFEDELWPCPTIAFDIW